jgi:hypothetical protein
MKHRKIGEELEKNQKTGEAIRYDYGKLRWDLMPDDALEKIVEIYTHGSIKYNDENWRDGFLWKRCIGSLKRHLKAFTIGEDIDEDSGALHLSQIAWNTITLLWYQIHFKGTDDRVITFDNPELMIKSKKDIQRQIDMFWKICEEKMKERENGKSVSGR